MRAAAALSVAALLAMVLQTTVLPALPVMPDLILVLAVYLGLRHRDVGGAIGAFLLGYFQDAFGGPVLGLQAFALTAVWAAVYLVAGSLWTEGGFPVIAVVLFGAVVQGLAMMAAALLTDTPGTVWYHVVRHGLVKAVVTAAVAPMVFRFVGWEKRLLDTE